MPVRVLLADDHAVFREALAAYLRGEGFDVTALCPDGTEAVRAAREQHPDVAVLDLSMPLLNGVEAVREIRVASPLTRAILLTVHAEASYVLAALGAGAAGYVLKTQAAYELVQAIQVVLRGESYLSPGISGEVVKACLSGVPAPPDPLTPRERQVIQLVAEGKSTRRAAEVLGVSPKTADSHRTRAMRKLGIHDTAGLVRYAIRRGLIEA